MNDIKNIEKLAVYDIVQNLPCILHTNYLYKLSEDEIYRLCTLSSVLSLKNSASDQALAYEIITKIFKNFYEEYPNLYSLAHAILSRLGNFPNRQLLNQYGFNELDLQHGPLIKLEVIARQSENKIRLKERNELLTDFQKTFFDVLTTEKFYSVSAPTSAGKSFVFVLSIIQRFIQNKYEKIVLVVPTRALIRELSEKVIKSLKEYNLSSIINVRTVPIMEEDSCNVGIIYVLTQERLNTLINEEEVHLDTVFIDEAQEIQSNRGVVLQNTIEILLRNFPNINIFFASPLIENPNYFNELLGLSFNQNFFIEEISPVGQNIIFLSSIKGKPKQAKVHLLSNSKNIDLGFLELNFNFRQSGRIIDLAFSITKVDELTLIYCNGPTEAEDRALELSNKITNTINDEEVNALIQFIKEDVHPDYSLIECLKKGIAYHYSHIPATVRTEIEKLSSAGKLQYVFCTSTLLQGVNLPTKNIILSNPTKGHGHPMQRSDFLNLIGRAGRLLHEFQGNIWCIDPEDWEEKSYEGKKLQKIESFYTKTLMNGANEVLELAVNASSQYQKTLTVFGKFYSDFIIDNKPLDKYKELKSFNTLTEAYNTCQKYNLELSNDIIKKHYSIHPKRLNNLYIYLKNKQDPEQWIPKNVFTNGIYESLNSIFKTIDEILLERNNLKYTLYSKYAFDWIHDKTLSEIINDNHNYNSKKEPDRKINKSIREVLKIIESEIRFNYVVYSSAYLDILKLVILEKYPSYDLEKIPNLPLYLECGSANRIVINLISLGLSRLTSIKLKKSKFFSCDEPTATNCFNALQKINIKNLDIPFICKQEIINLMA